MYSNAFSSIDKDRGFMGHVSAFQVFELRCRGKDQWNYDFEKFVCRKRLFKIGYVENVIKLEKTKMRALFSHFVFPLVPPLDREDQSTCCSLFLLPIQHAKLCPSPIPLNVVIESFVQNWNLIPAIRNCKSLSKLEKRYRSKKI